MANVIPKIFLCYTRADKEQVRKLYEKLLTGGFKPWMDMEDILPGEMWKSALKKAIKQSDFFLACLSRDSIDKRGVIQEEIKEALDVWKQKLVDDIYLIPARLEECQTPEHLSSFQWVNLYEEDGWKKLLDAIQEGMHRRLKNDVPPTGEPKQIEQSLDDKPKSSSRDLMISRETIDEVPSIVFSGKTKRDQKIADTVERVKSKKITPLVDHEPKSFDYDLAIPRKSDNELSTFDLSEQTEPDKSVTETTEKEASAKKASKVGFIIGNCFIYMITFSLFGLFVWIAREAKDSDFSLFVGIGAIFGLIFGIIKGIKGDPNDWKDAPKNMGPWIP